MKLDPLPLQLSMEPGQLLRLEAPRAREVFCEARLTIA
jgi:hypothetical protein